MRIIPVTTVRVHTHLKQACGCVSGCKVQNPVPIIFWGSADINYIIVSIS